MLYLERTWTLNVTDGSAPQLTFVSFNDGTDTNATTTNTVTLVMRSNEELNSAAVKFADQDPGAITEVSASVTLSDYTDDQGNTITKGEITAEYTSLANWQAQQIIVASVSATDTNTNTVTLDSGNFSDYVINFYNGFNNWEAAKTITHVYGSDSIDLSHFDNVTDSHGNALEQAPQLTSGTIPDWTTLAYGTDTTLTYTATGPAGGHKIKSLKLLQPIQQCQQ